ncbi:MAG: hypothetical protein H7A43_09045 [Verrucomicrobia bacterium]|nr:hypothetical protein [Kiritimatiellia bacterium]MCP5488784.1 hypothetical protein [Verrucomicrobiota bacterium]
MSYQEFIDLRERHAAIRITFITACLTVLWVIVWFWIYQIQVPEPGTPLGEEKDPTLAWLTDAEATFIRIWTPSLFALPTENPLARPPFFIPGISAGNDAGQSPVEGLSPAALPPGLSGLDVPGSVRPLLASDPPAPDLPIDFLVASPSPPVLSGERFFRGGVFAEWIGQKGDRKNLVMDPETAAEIIADVDLGWEVVLSAHRNDRGWLDQVRVEEAALPAERTARIRVWAAGQHLPGPGLSSRGTLRIRYLPERLREAISEGGAP